MSVNKFINLFLIETEYHLLISAGIILNMYNDVSQYRNLVVYEKSNTRLTKDYDVNNVSAEFLQIDTSPDKLVIELGNLLKIKPNRFFFFQEISSLNQFLIAKYKKKGSTICLAQDGAKPYAIYRKKHEFLSALKDTYLLYRELYKNKLTLGDLRLLWFYRYGQSSVIDEIWLTHPEKFNNPSKKKLVKIPELQKKSVLSDISELFKFKTTELLPMGQTEVLLYINQPINDENFILTEIDFLNSVIKKIGINKPFYIKIHPLTSQNTIEKYKRLSNVHVIYSRIPAELFILSLINSVVFSGWSAALLTYNYSCNYYYTYSIFQNINMLSQIQPQNPTDYIKILKTADEMDFPFSQNIKSR